METSDILDQTKENVQPLRKGRRADHLGTVLKATINNEAQIELDQQRQQYEMVIRVYDGDDPLEPRYEFVQWIEQSYPSLGPESKLIDLLEDTINIFKDTDKYKQDPRFIELLIKYINSQINPVELYQLAYNQGLGTMCAIFYEAWAEELDKIQDWKRANQVYELGIMSHAEPTEELKLKHEQFQLSVGRHMLTSDYNKPDSPEKTVIAPSRQALSKLHKSSVAGIRMPKGNPGVLRALPSVFGNNQRSMISIYQENNDPAIASGSVKSQMDHFPKAVVSNKENSLKAGPWKNKKSASSSSLSSSHYSTSSVVNIHAASSTPGFQVHEDEDGGGLPHQTPIVPRALKTIKADTFNCPVAIFEPSDPNVKVMYPKHKIYVGGREFQLEELKAAAYYKQHNLHSQYSETGYEFQTPMLFGKQGSSNRFLSTPSDTSIQKSIPVRLFADNSPDNSPNDSDKSASIDNFTTKKENTP
ncbi:mitotic checkpoint serine/threonine-protein kinase BUB1 beta-like [Lycorma delicatula]|uniref:mitotic checkpoint serine/threonine-protein kinase BUB1 beta-like n=1 Tax=Lycorma delicatula TaxID=130591 RepID=UPI003F50E514